MNIEATEHILRRCIILLYRKSGTHKTKQEYYYWIDWLKEQLKHYDNLKNIKIKNNIKKLILKNEFLVKDLKFFNK
jgi:hypothetical protein